MKKVLKVLKWFVLAIFAIIIILHATDNAHIVKGVRVVYLTGHTTGFIEDGNYFDVRYIDVDSGHTKPWLIHEEYNAAPLKENLQRILESTESVAFLVSRGDSIIHEQYWNGYSDTSHSNSFSAAKAITTLLVQKAIQDGYIESWNQKVVDFFPDLKGEFAQDLEIQHLAGMTSGMYWEEDYKNPFGITAKAYYSDDVWDIIKTLPIDTQPGSEFEYQSGSTMLLGMILIKATGRHLSHYASDALWKPLNAEQRAYWHIDQNMGTELAYCCFNSNARDFARFGKMNNHQGNWDGVQIIDSSFYPQSTTPSLAAHYGQGFWLTDKYNTQVFYHHGLHGQYIISIPEYNLVVVRLGETQGPKTEDKHTKLFHTIVAEIIEQYGLDYPPEPVIEKQTTKDNSNEIN